MRQNRSALLKAILFVLLSIESISSRGLPRLFQNRFASLKKRMNKLMQGEKGNELFVDISELEYPKANITLRRIYEEQWQEYYACLKNQLDDAGPEKTVHPIALLALEGTSLKMKCKLCVSPAELFTSELIEWVYNASGNVSVENLPLETSEHVLITPDERDLNLYDVQMSATGIYWCKMDDTASAPYYLQVVNEETESTRAVRPESAIRAENRPAPPRNLGKYGLKVFSLWTSWSPCSACDVVGQRIRYGYCTISLIDIGANSNDESTVANRSETEENTTNEIEETKTQDNFDFRDGESSLPSDRHRRQARNETTTEASSKTTLGMTAALNTDDEPDEINDVQTAHELKILAQSVLPTFRNRLPCRSSQTPKGIRNIKEIAARKTEVMTGFCKIICEKEVVFEVRDRFGNILESANNSAGIFSMIQGMPEPRPSVQRITIYRKHGKRTKITCPGNLNSDVPVIWQIGTKVLVSSAIENESAGRISIDERDRISIEKLRFADENIYSCWQRGELAGTVRLHVTYEVELKVDYRVFMVGAIIITSVMLKVFWRAFRSRKRYAIR